MIRSFTIGRLKGVPGPWFESLCAMLLISVFFSGCTAPMTLTHPVTPTIQFIMPKQAVIPGRFLLHIDPALRDLQADVVPSSSACSSHNYPVHIGYSFAHALINAVRFRFEEILFAEKRALMDHPGKADADGGVMIDLVAFRPCVTCPLAGRCREYTEVILRIRVVDALGKVLLDEPVRGSYSLIGGSSLECGEIAPHLNHSIGAALHNTLVLVTGTIGDAFQGDSAGN